MHVKAWVGVFLLIGSLLCFQTGCKEKDSEKILATRTLDDPKDKNGIVLEVEDAVYVNSDFESSFQSLFGKDFNELQATSLSRLFDDFVDEKIYSHAANVQAISLTIDEQKKYLTKLSRDSHLEEGKSPLGQEEFVTHLERLRIEKYMALQVEDVEATEEEIREYYTQYKKEFLRPERVRVSQILLETEGKAIDVLERVKNASEEIFRIIAGNESRGVEAAKGGEMGIFEMGQLPFEMEKVIFSLKVGEISPVVESAYGYHIFRLDDKFEPELVSEEQAISEIRMKIMNQKIKQALSEHLKGLKEQIKWNAYPSNLSFEYQRKNHEEM